MTLPTGRDVVNLGTGQLNTHDVYGNPTAAVLELASSHLVGWSQVDTYVSPYVGDVGLSVPWPMQDGLQPTLYGAPLLSGQNGTDPNYISFTTSARFALTDKGLAFAGPKDLLDFYALTSKGIVPPPFYLTPQARLNLALAETGERHFEPEQWSKYSFLLRHFLVNGRFKEVDAREGVAVFIDGTTNRLDIDGVYNGALQSLKFHPTPFDGHLEQSVSFPDLTVQTYDSDFGPNSQQAFRVGNTTIEFQLLTSYASSGHKNVGFHHDFPPVLILDNGKRVSGHVGLNSEGTHYVVTFPGFKGYLTHPRIIENVEAKREFRLKVESRSGDPNMGQRKTQGCVASLIPEHQREAFGLAMAHPDPRVPLALAPVMDQLGDLSPTRALRLREIMDTSRSTISLSTRLSGFFTDIVVRDLGRLARNEEGSTSAEYALGPMDTPVRQGRALGGNLAMLGGAVYKAWEKSQASGESFFTTFGHTVAADFVRLWANHIGEETLAGLFKVFSHTALNLLARSGLGGLASFGINSFTGETDFSLTSLARHTLIDGFGFGGMNAGVEALALKVLGKSFGASFAASLLGVGLATLVTSEVGRVWDNFLDT